MQTPRVLKACGVKFFIVIEGEAVGRRVWDGTALILVGYKANDSQHEFNNI